MTKWHFHTPEGFIDIMPSPCASKRRMEQKLRELFGSFHYREIETPGMEFLDVYTCGDGFAVPEQLFKTFDHRGRVLASRFDGTIPVARMVATKFADQPLPLRLSYIENMFRFDESGGGRQKGFTQAGVELLGSVAPTADGEVVALAIRAALTAGISQIQVTIGQVDFFRGVSEEWGLNEEQEQRLIRMIDAKELVAIEQFCEEESFSGKARQVLSLMLQGSGQISQIDDYAKLVDNPRSLAALDNLRQVLSYLDDLDLLSFISLDLGLLQSLDYYTGMIFKGFTYAMGYPLFSGGRYDRVVSAFGRDLPATGFSIGIDFALTALSRQGCLPVDSEQFVVVAYAQDQRKSALAHATLLRNEGRAVEICYSTKDKEEAIAWAAERQAEWLDYIDSAGELQEIPLLGTEESE
ncbi:MAG: ATP phosphoribosyltransferase regulatory subunit [Fastidiosipilaceae bacterium]|jgi:ATP phosphoribosyltransferase regulatory subunit